MNQPVRDLVQTIHTGTRLETGRVAERTAEGRFSVFVGPQRFEAEQAFGCLVTPESGDTVLLSLSEEVYILNILARPEHSGREIIFNGPASIKTIQGELSIGSADDVRIASRRKMSLSSEELNVSAVSADARLDSLSWMSRVVSGRVKRIRLVAESMDTIARKAVSRLVDSFRYVKRHDELQAKSSRMLVDDTLTMHTGHTMHTAKGHVKIDAEQIHVG